MARAKKRGKAARAPRKAWHGLKIYFGALALAFALLAAGIYRFWTSDAVQMRFVYMWDYQQDIIDASRINGLDPFLVAAVIKNESNFRHDAVSAAGAIGLMQIMPETGRFIASRLDFHYRDDDLYVAKNNIRMGCWYLAQLDMEFKHNLVLVLMAYNAGRGVVSDWLEKKGWNYAFNEPENIPYEATRSYVTAVLEDRDKYYLLYKDKVR